MADNRFFNLIRKKKDTQSTKADPLPVVMSGTEKAVPGNLHRSDSLTEQIATGRMGNDFTYPTIERFILEADHERYQDIANSHLSEGPTPGRIPRPYNDRTAGKIGSPNTPEGRNTFLLGLSGVSAGGQGDAMYIQHTSVIRPAGKASGSLRTIDDGAQVPGVYLADPTRR
jgi:hypothetical protein